MSEALPKPRGQRTLLRDAVEVALIAVVLYIAISFALQTVRVDGTSMVPTLHDGDLLIASKLTYRFHEPERGDIIVLLPPNEDRDFIKRIIGLPGDQIKIVPVGNAAATGASTDSQLFIRIGGQGPWERVKEPYLGETWNTMNDCCTPANPPGLLWPAGQDHPDQPFTIPALQYFVMGDNRNHSSDSRAIGLIPRDRILAKAFVRLLPINTFGGFTGGQPLLLPQVLVPLPALAIQRGRRRVTRRLRRAA